MPFAPPTQGSSCQLLGHIPVRIVQRMVWTEPHRRHVTAIQYGREDDGDLAQEELIVHSQDGTVPRHLDPGDLRAES